MRPPALPRRTVLRMHELDEQTVEYFCPRQRYPISRAVHLGRLAGGYPGCRQCPHRDETGTLSARRLRLIEETRSRGQSQTLFYREGAAGVYLNDLSPATAQELAAALGVFLRNRQPGDAESPVAAVAGDGRPLAPELVVAAAEGLRWAGCHVIDVGQASAPCMAFAIEHLDCSGGLLVGSHDGRSQTVGLKFWADGAQPLSTGGPLDAIRRLFLVGPDRPTRSRGSLRRLPVDGAYLAAFAEHYHALRPLRIVVQSTCRPLLGYLDRLTGQLACRVVTCPTTGDRADDRGIVDRVRAEQAHFGVRIDDDGQQCRAFDERGAPLPCQRLLLLLAEHIVSSPLKKGATAGLPSSAKHKLHQNTAGQASSGTQIAGEGLFQQAAEHLIGRRSGAKIVLEDATSPALIEKIRRLGAEPIVADARRAEMYRAMKAGKASIGGGPSGCFWHVLGGSPLPDSLVTITLLLEILSQSDRPLSEVLDARATLA